MAANRKPAKPTKPAPKKEPRKRSAPDWAPRFLAALAETGNVTAAARAAGVNRDTFYQRRDADEDFARAAAQSLETATDALELEARRRAHDGCPRVKFHKGEPLAVPGPGGEPVPYVEHEYSDTLLIFLLKAHRPEKYRDRLDLTGTARMELVEEIVDAPGDGTPDDSATPDAGGVPPE